MNALVKREAMARGLCVYPMGGTIDGVNGDHVLVAPPFIVNTGQVDEIVDAVVLALLGFYYAAYSYLRWYYTDWRDPTVFLCVMLVEQSRETVTALRRRI